LEDVAEEEEAEAGQLTALSHSFGTITGDDTQSAVNDEGQYTTEEHGTVQTFPHYAVVFADELVDAVPVVDDVLDGGAEDCDHGDGAYERYQRRGHLVAIVKPQRFLLRSGDPMDGTGDDETGSAPNPHTHLLHGTLRILCQ